MAFVLSFFAIICITPIMTRHRQTNIRPSLTLCFIPHILLLVSPRWISRSVNIRLASANFPTHKNTQRKRHTRYCLVDACLGIRWLVLCPRQSARISRMATAWPKSEDDSQGNSCVDDCRKGNVSPRNWNSECGRVTKRTDDVDRLLMIYYVKLTDKILRLMGLRSRRPARI